MTEDTLRYYEKRVNEFERLLEVAQSQTLIDLINKAKLLSEQSVNKLISIQSATVQYLSDHNRKNVETIEKYNKHLEDCQAKITQIKNAILPDDIRTELNEFYKNHLATVQKKLEFHAEINTLTINTFTNCCNEFQKTLLEIVFKPQSNQFHYESVLDILNYLAGKLLPGLDELKMASSFTVKLRKRQFVKSGDKILLYLEQYIDVLENLDLLSEAYLKILKE
jgi:hypothetical protein